MRKKRNELADNESFWDKSKKAAKDLFCRDEALTSKIDELQSLLKEKERVIAHQAQEIQAERNEKESLATKLNAISDENSRLRVEKQTLSNQISDLEAKRDRAGHLEESIPALLDWIQSVLGYAGNQQLFPNETDELSQFRDDAKRLTTLLRQNGIECVNTPMAEGLGFLRKRDARIAEGQEPVISAPMLLRDGMIVAEGIMLVPDVDEPRQESSIEPEDNHESNPTTGSSFSDSSAESGTAQSIPDSQSKPDSDCADNKCDSLPTPSSPQSLVNQPVKKTAQANVTSGGESSPWDFEL